MKKSTLRLLVEAITRLVVIVSAFAFLSLLAAKGERGIITLIVILGFVLALFRFITKD